MAEDRLSTTSLAKPRYLPGSVVFGDEFSRSQEKALPHPALLEATSDPSRLGAVTQHMLHTETTQGTCRNAINNTIEIKLFREQPQKLAHIQFKADSSSDFPSPPLKIPTPQRHAIIKSQKQTRKTSLSVLIQATYKLSNTQASSARSSRRP